LEAKRGWCGDGDGEFWKEKGTMEIVMGRGCSIFGNNGVILVVVKFEIRVWGGVL
jgi:hypothetical protein